MVGMWKALGPSTSTEKKQNKDSLQIKNKNQVCQQNIELTDYERSGMIISEEMKTLRLRNGPEVYPAAR